MSKEAMKLALEALESYKGFIDDAHILEGQWHWIDGADNAQAALREALEEQPAQQQERLTKAEQRMVHDFPHLAQFHAKHALGPMLPPSCLCCGHQTNPITHPVAVQHMELPGVVICKSCHDAALAQPQQEPVAIDRIIECAKRLVDHADFQLGGVLSQDSKAKDIPSRAVSQVKARHLAALRDALANTSPPAQRKPLTLGQKQRLWSSVGDKPTLKDRVNAYGLAIEAAHGITKGNT